MYKQKIVFNPQEEESLEVSARLVIYDEKYKSIFFLKEIEKGGNYTVYESDLDYHLKYIYKYQVMQNGEWIDVTKYKSLRFERKTDEGIKYLLYPEPTSNYLIVGFQGISKNPGYNYVRTLKEANATQLYIKDDYGTDLTTSSYYLGPRGDFSIAKNTLELIEVVRTKFNVKKENVICIGSSKGGYASLYFAYKASYGHVVVGGPQTKLGTYLSQGKSAEKLDSTSFMHNILRYLVGTVTDDKIVQADLILFEEVQNSQSDPNIFIHVGRGEPHYKKHVKPFIEFTNKLDLKNVEVNIGNYDKHAELAKHFPVILKKKVNEIIKC